MVNIDSFNLNTLEYWSIIYLFLSLFFQNNFIWLEIFTAMSVVNNS